MPGDDGSTAVKSQWLHVGSLFLGNRQFKGSTAVGAYMEHLWKKTW